MKEFSHKSTDPANRSATLKKIADHMGLSAATVSRALRPETADLVKASTREAILEVADRIGFVPNPGARLLLKGASSSLTLVVPRNEEIFLSEYYGRLMAGVLHAVADIDWDLRISAVDQIQGSALERLRGLGVESSGMMYAGLPLQPAQVEELKTYLRPLVVFGAVLPPDVELRKEGPCVVEADQYAGGRLAVSHLAALGHRRIGIISGPVESRDFVLRLRGFRRGLEEHGLDIDDTLLYEGSYEQGTGRSGCRKLLSVPHPPTALLCANDWIALGALDEARLMGFALPDCLSILGFDDGRLAEQSHPALSTVRQPLAVMTEYAVQEIKRALEGKRPRSRQFPCSIVKRDTCAPPPDMDKVRRLNAER